MSDILWRNTMTGQLEIWFISGSSVIGGRSPGTITLDWQVQTYTPTDRGVENSSTPARGGPAARRALSGRLKSTSVPNA